tara:strand:+ start:21268 stop:22908 length:1641 start_codon:yes stop_codon:yes gene_type:complete
MVGCPQSKSKQKKADAGASGQPVIRKTVEQKGAWEKGWIKKTWLDIAANNAELLKPYLGEDASEEVREDVRSLLDNQLASALQTSRNPGSLNQTGRVLRARMHLRMARFYGLLWTMAARQQVLYNAQRWQLNGKIQLGKMFHYYYGRLLCLQGKSKEGITFLKQSVSKLSADKQDRARAWLIACDTSKSKEDKQKALAALKFADDDDGKDELLLLQELFQLTLKKAIETSNVRGRLFEASLQGKRMKRKPLIGGRPVDSEMIKEKDINAEIRYYDPAIPRARMRIHAFEVLRFLKSAKDSFAPLFRAEAHMFLGQKQEAQKSLAQFEKAAPKKMVWAYVFFSDGMTLGDWKRKARLMKISLLPASEQKKQLSALVKETKTFPAKLMVALACLRAGVEVEETSKWVEQGANLVHDLKLRLNKHYRVGKKDMGSVIVRKIRLYRYAWRAGYLLASRAVLYTKKPYLASNWLEILHDKDALHKIAKGNEATQILWTIRALLYKRDYRTAVLYLLKNRRDYPSLDQIREPLNLLLIGNNKGGPGVIKEGG